ncbi:MAG TPA: CapA family protein [Geminicoccaceae bacterium]|nr:CapA family protein [Geminicoccus sp.]HMU53003.1 CapA family protein [Geminicoccaceae bacterium]
MSRGLTVVVTGQTLIERPLPPAATAEEAGLVEAFRAADLALAGLEVALHGPWGGWPIRDATIHTAPTDVLDSLRELGLSGLSLACNHACDLGPPAILATRREVGRRGFLHAGTGADEREAAAPGFVQTANGRVALVSVDASGLPDYACASDPRAGLPARPGVHRLRILTEIEVAEADYRRLAQIIEETGHRHRREGRVAAGHRQPMAEGRLDFHGTTVRRGQRAREHNRPHDVDLERLLASIRRASGEAELVLACLHHHHWAPEWSDTPAWVPPLAHACVEAGAHLFLSHGVPVLQAVELYRGRPIFHGLGNLIFQTARPQRYGPAVWEGVAASCTFDAQGQLVSATLLPIEAGGPPPLAARPRIANGSRGEAIRQRLAGLSGRFGTTIELDSGRLALAG